MVESFTPNVEVAKVLFQLPTLLKGSYSLMGNRWLIQLNDEKYKRPAKQSIESTTLKGRSIAHRPEKRSEGLE